MTTSDFWALQVEIGEEILEATSSGDTCAAFNFIDIETGLPSTSTVNTFDVLDRTLYSRHKESPETCGFDQFLKIHEML
ncbi:hypothetical protein AVEN_147975-1 [Araneus ventricosus]|uniref:Uncharacterized protein n=1 Tax=Araneus ventricosus TaxID=182803 RepID=A0A4Y2H3P2_ARAVE|nr:hypothetical protein AVEN_147975-1 [Araneus ventricosus]